MEKKKQKRMEDTLYIRTADIRDAEELLAIYAPYVQNTAITFEYDIPAPDEFRERIRQILTRYPYLVAESGGQIVGYAYASPFHVRRAYDWAVELSVYLKVDCRGYGYGKKLYHTLEQILKKQHFLNLNACIACTDQEDVHLTNKSVAFHEHMGYRTVGKFHQCGYKFEKWYDMVWMEKFIGEHSRPEEIIPFREIAEIHKNCFTDSEFVL